MSLIGIVIVLAVIGFLLWALNTQAGEYIDGKYLKLINIVVFVFTLIWLLQVFGVWGAVNTVQVQPLK